MGFKLCALTLGLGIAGAMTCAASDFSRASALRDEMQTALDATSRRLFADAGKSDLPDAITDKFARNYFFKLLDAPEAAAMRVSAAVLRSTEGGRRVVVYGHGEVYTRFLRLVGIESLSVSASAAAEHD